MNDLVNFSKSQSHKKTFESRVVDSIISFFKANHHLFHSNAIKIIFQDADNASSFVCQNTFLISLNQKIDLVIYDFNRLVLEYLSDTKPDLENSYSAQLAKFKLSTKYKISNLFTKKIFSDEFICSVLLESLIYDKISPKKKIKNLRNNFKVYQFIKYQQTLLFADQIVSKFINTKLENKNNRLVATNSDVKKHLLIRIVANEDHSLIETKLINSESEIDIFEQNKTFLIILDNECIFQNLNYFHNNFLNIRVIF